MFPELFSISHTLQQGYTPPSWHRHDQAQVDCLIRGRSEVRFFDRTLTLRPGMVLIIAPRHFHGISLVDGSEQFLARVDLKETPTYWNPALAGGANFDWMATQTVLVRRGRRLRALLAETERLWSEGGRWDVLAAQAHFLRFCEAVGQAEKVLIDWLGADRRPSADTAHFIRATTYMAQAYRNPRLSNRDVARACGISPALLYKVFLRHSDCGPKEFLRRLRVEQARELIVSDEKLGLKAVAEATGFPDLYAFSRVYKRLTHSAPGRFRAQYRAWITAARARSRRLQRHNKG